MRFVYILIVFCINLFTYSIYSQTIVVVNIQSLIDDNNIYKNIISDIELSQQKYLNNFLIKENELKLQFKEIEDSKLILSENEINLQIDEYNKQLTEFTKLIEEFNFHYQNEIIKIRESVLKEIIELLQKFAIENNVDLILDSTSYLIASNSLDITNDIKTKLENLKFKIEYNDFKKN